MVIAFWILVGIVGYSLVGYGVLMIAWSRLKSPRNRMAQASRPLRVTVVVAAHNEEGFIGRKIDNLRSLQTAPHSLDILVVSDGSTDNTVQEARARGSDRLKLKVFEEHVGKRRALIAALQEVSADIVVLTDANSSFHLDALQHLLRHFADPSVGGVCGALSIRRRRSGWLRLAEHLYWRYDNALKEAESAIGGAVSAQGSLYAIRSELFMPIPPAVADDLYISLGVVSQNRRLVYEPKAITQEEVTENSTKELHRRVRSTEQGWRGLMIMSSLLNPLRHGFYSLQLFSHKVLRRLVAFLLPALYVVNACTLDEGWWYQCFFWLQSIFYGIALSGWMIPAVRRLPGVSIATFFLMGHAAMALGMINVWRGKKTDRWLPARDKGNNDEA